MGAVCGPHPPWQLPAESLSTYLQPERNQHSWARDLEKINDEVSASEDSPTLVLLTPQGEISQLGAGGVCPIFWFWLRLGFLRKLAGVGGMGLAINLKEPSPFYKGVWGGCFSPSRGLFTSPKSPC